MGAVPLQEAKASRLGNRDTSATSAIAVAAITGPTPKTSVRLVRDALTAAVIFLRVSRSWASMRRRSARCSAARSCQACSVVPTGWRASRIAVARLAVMFSGTPPGVISHSVACRRQAAWVRSRETAGGGGTRCAARLRGHRPGLGGRPVIAGRPPRPSGRRSGRSCSTCRWTGAGPGRRAWAGHRRPARRRPAAAGPARGPGRPRLQPPRSARAIPLPIPAACRPAPRWHGL